MTTNSAVVYCRVSGAGQVTDGTGLERQAETCRQLAADKGFHVTQVFREEGVSGTKESGDRPAYQRMLAHMQASGTSTVLVEHLDRLARYYRVQEELLNGLIDRGVTLYAANTGENITAAMRESPMRKFIVQLQGLLSELDRSQTVAKLNKGRAAKKAAGGKAEGRYPFGRDPKLPEEAPVLSMILDMRDRGVSCESIALALNVSGKRGRSGCIWQAATVAKILRREAA